MYKYIHTYMYIYAALLKNKRIDKRYNIKGATFNFSFSTIKALKEKLKDCQKRKANSHTHTQHVFLTHIHPSYWVLQKNWFFSNPMRPILLLVNAARYHQCCQWNLHMCTLYSQLLLADHFLMTTKDKWGEGGLHDTKILIKHPVRTYPHTRNNH